MCSKVPYPTEREAIGARLRSVAFFRKDFRVYECDACKQWHLTSRLLPWQTPLDAETLHVPIDQFKE